MSQAPTEKSGSNGENAPSSSLLSLPQLRPSAIAEEPVSRAELIAEAEEKSARVQEFLHVQNLGGVLLTEVRNFSWITAGLGSNRIVITSETGAASLLIMRRGEKFLIASNSEAARLMNEDLDGLDYTLQDFEWHEHEAQQRIAEQMGAGQPIGTDTPHARFTVIDFAPQRYQLTDSEIQNTGGLAATQLKPSLLSVEKWSRE